MNDVTDAGGTIVSNGQAFGTQLLIFVEEWGPRVVAACLILVIGWLVARGIKWGVARLVNSTPLARHANDPGHGTRHPETIGAQVGDAAYWVVLLIALFLATQPLGLTGASGPLSDMVRGFSQAVPHIIGASLIFFIGYVLAKVARKAVEAVITASHVERFSSRLGDDAPTDPSALPRALGAIVFALVIIPVAIAALDTLNIAAVSQPATAMLRIVLDAIPHVIAAGIILSVAWVIGRFASRLLVQFLGTTGFDHAVRATGLWHADRRAGDQAGILVGRGGLQPARLVGNGAFIAIVIFGLMEAFRQLDFAYGSRIMAEVLSIFGQVVFGSIIIFAAVLIARFVARAIEGSSDATTRFVAPVVRIAIIILGAAIGLKFMGLADDIINMAFGLLFGAVAVAFAIAFGLGGREAAGRAVARLLDDMSRSPATAGDVRDRPRDPGTPADRFTPGQASSFPNPNLNHGDER